MREEDDVADGGGVGEDHEEAVDAEAQTTSGGHAVLQGHQEVLVDEFGLFVARGAETALGLEALALVDRVVEFGVGVGELPPSDEGLEALYEGGVVGLALGEGRDLDGIVDQEGRLDEVGLNEVGDEEIEELAPAGLLGDVDVARAEERAHRLHAAVLG